MKLNRKTLVSMSVQAFGIVALLALHVIPATGQEAEPNVDDLPIDKTIERRLGKSEIHMYSVELKRGESLQLDLTEKGVDCFLVFSVFDADLTKRYVVDVGGGFDRETFTYIPQDNDKHLVAVAAKLGSAGLYSLLVRINSTTGTAEQKRALASYALAQAMELWASSEAARDIELVIRQLETALSLWKDLKEDYWVGYIANALGRIYTELSEKQKAIEHLNVALEIFRQINDEHGEALATNNLGIVYAQYEEFEKALDLFSTSLALREKTGDKVGRARVLSAVGALYESTGSWRDAISNYEKALSILRDAESPQDEANVLGNLGTLHLRAGDPTKATNMLMRALALLNDIADTRVKINVLNSVASVNSAIGDLHKAMEYYQQSLKLAESGGKKQHIATACWNISVVYQKLGELEKALAYSERALTILREIGDESNTVHALINLAGLQEDLGDERKMWELLNEVKSIVQKRGTIGLRNRVTLLLQGGDILAIYDQNENARLAYLQALEISRSSHDRTKETIALSKLAGVYRRMGDSEKSSVTYYQAFISASITENPDSTAGALSDLMLLWQVRGHPRLAIFYGKEAINKYQQLRTNIRAFDSEIQKAYLITRANIYVHLADLLLEQGRHAEALQVINTSHDQQFYDFNREQNTPAEPITLTSREAVFSLAHKHTVQPIITLGKQLDGYSRQVGKESSTEEKSRLDELEEQFSTASKEFMQLLTAPIAEFSRPPTQWDEVAPVKSLEEMQSILRALSAATGQKTVALYTLVGEDHFRILLVTPDSVATAKSNVTKTTLERKLLQYYALLQSPTYDPRPLGQELYDLIVKPIDPALRAAGAQTLLWSLSGTLRYVPMASLWDGKHYLAERYQHVVFTRADRARMLSTASAGWTGVGFGNSRAHAVDLFGNGNKVSFEALPGVTEELRAIFRAGGSRGIIKGEVIADDRFTKQSFLNISKKPRTLVHVASHFSFRPGDDTKSFLLLGDGTTLTLNEMKQREQLFEGVELLTLSACDTAALRADAWGKEIDGFAESAQRLGAKAVLATLWTVADNSTPQLMNEFYRARQVGGLTKAEALRRAQLALLKRAPLSETPLQVRTNTTSGIKVEIVNSREIGRGPKSRNLAPGADVVYVEEKYARPFTVHRNNRFAHPYYWAPFILIGNGR